MVIRSFLFGRRIALNSSFVPGTETIVARTLDQNAITYIVGVCFVRKAEE